MEAEEESYRIPAISESGESGTEEPETPKDPIALGLTNVALNKPVTTSQADDFYVQRFPASRLTDGESNDALEGAIINYLETGLAWYEIDLQGAQTINQIKLIFQNAEWEKRPQDYAIDVYADGEWKRVAEQHKVQYTVSEYFFNFAPVSCTKIRITALNARNATDNFRLEELEAYNNPTVTEAYYTPLMEADEAVYRITVPEGEGNPVTGEASRGLVCIVALLSFAGLCLLIGCKRRKAGFHDCTEVHP